MTPSISLNNTLKYWNQMSISYLLFQKPFFLARDLWKAKYVRENTYMKLDTHLGEILFSFPPAFLSNY